MSLEGEIGEIQLVERLVELWREQFTGAIRFESDGIIKIVYFKGGDILSASTNDRADSIDEILMRAGKVTREHVKQALAKRKETETLGDALLNLGFITRKELSWARRVQVVGVIRSIAAWTTGSFTIVADYLPKRDEGTLFPLPQIIVELIVTEADRPKFDRALEGGEAVFAKTADFEDVFRRLGLNEEAEQIVREVDGVKTAADVAGASGKDTFNVYKLLHALATLGVLARTQEVRVEPEVSDAFATAGVADAADMWDFGSEPAPAEPEPVVQAQPMFDFDEAEAVQAPTLEVPIGALPDDEPTPAPVKSAWDEEEEAAPAAPAPMPRWEAPAEPVGFDEAQIETARKATAPVAAAPVATPPPVTPSPMLRAKQPPAKKSRFGLVVALMVVFILAAAGYFGYMAWLKKQEEATPVAAAEPPRPRPTPPPVTTSVEAAVPAAVPTTTTAEPATTTTNAAAVGIAPNTTTTTTTTTTPPAAEAAAATQRPPAPAATAGATGRERYDAMARQYAANPTGNFTVQIQILCDPANLDKVIRGGGSEVWFVPQTIGARSCYRVLWGHFGTREEAQRAMGQIPAALRDPAAAVKPVPR